MADSVIKVDADTGSAQPKLEGLRKTATATANEYARGGREIRAQGDAAKRVNSELDQMAKSHLKSLIGITAIVAMTKQLITANEQVRSNAASATKERQNVAMSAGAGLSRLNRAGILDAESSSQIFNQVDNATDRSGAADLLNAIGEKASKDRRFKSRLSADRIQGALAALESGTFSRAEIETTLEKGGRFDIGERMAAMPAEARAAFEQRRKVTMAERATEASLSDKGQIVDANMRRQIDQSALLTLFSNLGLDPLIRSGVRANNMKQGAYDFGFTGAQEVGARDVRVINQPQPRPQMSGDNQSER
jgi:hypothetical protein